MAVLDCAAKPAVGYFWHTPSAIKFHPANPTLRPLLTSASGETLLLLVQNAELLAKCMPPTAAAEVLPALLVRAAQHGECQGRESCALWWVCSCTLSLCNEVQTTDLAIPASGASGRIRCATPLLLPVP